MKKNVNRRDFLVSSVQTLGALGFGSQMIGMFLGSVYSKALADGGSTLAMNADGFRYVFVSLSGAPPRWMFDMLPTPNGPTKDAYVTGGFGNAFNISGNNIALVNKPFAHNYGSGKTIYLPPVWGMSPSRADFTSLLQHTLFIRGMDMEINNHTVSNSRQVAPILGGKSLHGVIADMMGSPVAAVVHASPSGAAFKSAKGLGSVTADYNSFNKNPVKSLIAPFKSLPSKISFRSDEVKPVIEQFLNRIDSYAENNRIPSSTLREAHDSADQLIRLNIDEVANNWESLLAKYTLIVDEAIRPDKEKGELKGINDKPIPLTAGDFRFRYDVIGGSLFLNLADARDMIDKDVNKSEIAQQFALTEFLLTSGICSVVDISCANSVMNNVKVSATNRARITCDQHNVGVIPSVIATTLFYRGLLAAMTELVKTLKEKNIFNKTIIHISAEFNRSPRADGSGADHGVSGGSATLISGMFNEVAFMGNILKNGTPANPGTWGVAADWEFENGDKRPIHVNDVARSITAMTGAKDIVANGYSLVQPSGNGLWVPKKSGGKNV